MEQVIISEFTPQGVNKVARYGWRLKDSPGEIAWVDKTILKINEEYQRSAIKNKIADITAEWSWLACGALIVAKRDGSLWVVDGQHRLLAAMRRSDIRALPCVIFETETIKDEAIGFLSANTNRRPVTAIGKHKALVASGDEAASFVSRILEAKGLRVVRVAKMKGHIKCLAWCVKRAAVDSGRFVRIIDLASEMCFRDEMPVHEKLLEGLWIIDCKIGLNDPRLKRRVLEVGTKRLVDAAARAAVFYGGGGGKAWAEGILGEINKGLKNKFTIEGGVD